MYHDNKIWVGTSGEEKIYIYPKMANRHGLIAGATGTGKTVTLKVLAESFSDCGVPVFLEQITKTSAAVWKKWALQKKVLISLLTQQLTGIFTEKKGCLFVQQFQKWVHCS